MTRAFGFGLFLAACVALAACGSDEKKPPPVDPKAPPAGSSAAFKDGFAPGCAAGTQDAHSSSSSLTLSRGGDKEQAHRYASEPDYKAGWDGGYNACWGAEHRGSMIGDFNPFGWF